MEQTLTSVGGFIDRAREQHARTGEWPPDPLLDEIDEMRRRVQAEHGDDPWKLLKWYNQAGDRKFDHDAGASTQDSKAAEQEACSREAEKQERPAA
ncbi:hypothetical protein [Longimicrobium sp.]|uniref:hypothetical protein n=1 Tax=Longimicrobium sp. TaxID=2029185 RepID=UPI003B3B98EC